MEDEEFIRLIQLVEGQLRERGLAHVAAEENFIELPELDEPARLMEPKERLIALLEAFDIHLMLNDSSVARRSLSLISEACDGPGPETAIVVKPLDRGATPTENLLDLPNLDNLREELKKLLYRIRETPRGGGFPGAARR